jgi:hypothetical protein
MSLQGTQINGFPDFLRGETRKISRPFTRRGIIGPRRDSKDISLTILGFCISRICEINCFSFPKNTSVRPCELGHHRFIRSDLKSACGGPPYIRPSCCNTLRNTTLVHKTIQLTIQKHNSTDEESEWELC